MKIIRKWNHQRIQFLRKVRLVVLKILIDQKNKNFDSNRVSFKATDVKNIVLLRLDGKLGDTVTSTGLVKNLNLIFPNALIDVLGDQSYQLLYKNFPFVRVIHQKKGFLNAILYVFSNDKKYDILINSSEILSPSSVWITRFLSAKTKYSFLNKIWKLFDFHADYDPNQTHITQRYQSVLNEISKAHQIQISDLNWSYQLPEIKSEFHLKGINYIVLNSFAGASLRNLNQQNTLLILKQLLEKFPDFKIVSIANVGDQNILKRWKQEWLNSNSEALFKNWDIGLRGDLEYNFQLIQNAALVITPDTSIVHIACAFKTPLVALYRKDHREEKNMINWAPLGTRYSVIEVRTDPNYEDINQLDVDQVLRVVQAELLHQK